MNKWYRQTDVMLGLAVVSIVAMLIIPMPAFLLDVFLAFSIMIGLIILLTAMSNKNNLDFSVFPSLLLVSTVFRLALNVSSTRLILTEGPNFDGQLIRAFGEFVVSGQYVIGFIIFLILVLVQLMVITKGATRISEVAARFTLDALPGKQMSIDSDLSAGLITEEEARKNRAELRKEVDFYGQMDGATKFVQGDVRVGLIITAINIVGGLVIGMSMRGESLEVALETYTLLTIGDGLVSQIPSLLITTATGMVVTRAGADQDLGGQLSSQLFNNPKILWMVAGTLGVASLLPGFPMISMWSVAGLLGFIAYSITQTRIKDEKEQARLEDEKAKKPDAPESFLDEISLDVMRLEIGYNLIPLVESTQGGTLLERITNLRKKFARDMGLVVPPIRINDNMDLDGNEYSILVSGIEVGRAKAYPDKLVALDSGRVKEAIEGEVFEDPTYSLPAVLIDTDKKSDAEEKGYLVVDAGNIIITHISEIIRTYATQVMGREEVKLLLDKLKEKFPAVVEEVNRELTMGIIQQVLHNLIKENVSIRNANVILETLADQGGKTKDPTILTEYVRLKLGRQIIQPYVEDGVLHSIQVDPMIENALREAVTFDEREGRIFTLDPHEQIRIRDSLIAAFNSVQKQEKFPIFVLGSEVRTGVFMILERELSSRMFASIAYEEIPTDIRVEIVGQAILADNKETEEEVVF
ncbi:MAG: flagellar biosynthesis protein FlhA [Leptospirales bacterium]